MGLHCSIVLQGLDMNIAADCSAMVFKELVRVAQASFCKGFRAWDVELEALGIGLKAWDSGFGSADIWGLGDLGLGLRV